MLESPAHSFDAPLETPTPVTRRADGVWAPGRRRLTAGLVLTVTLVAFESLAISTVMPVVADDLGGLGLYGWVFSGFFLGSLLGIVVSGQLADRRGTRLPFVAGLVCFTIGLAIGASAQSMGMLVAGRVAQGFGAGVIPAVAYVSIGRAYPAELRPRVFAVFSSAWVIPGLVGPAAASTIADLSSWRAVFGGLLPLVLLAALMTLPTLTNGAPADADLDVDTDTDTATGGDAGDGAAVRSVAAAEERSSASRLLNAVVLVGGVALVLGGLGASSVPVAAALVVVGLVPAVVSFLRLVPAGTVRLAAGLPAAVGVRGILTLAFFGADAYVSLTVTEGLGSSTRMAGAALTAGTLTWTAGSWIQQKVIVERGPRWLVQWGFLCVALGIAGLLVLVPLSLPGWTVVPAWAIGGLGMGLSYGPLSVTALDLAEPGREGEATASLQLTDVLGVSVGTGLGGVFVALGESQGWEVGSSLVLVFTTALVVAVAGIAAARRLPRTISAVAAEPAAAGEPAGQFAGQPAS